MSFLRQSPRDAHQSKETKCHHTKIIHYTTQHHKKENHQTEATRERVMKSEMKMKLHQQRQRLYIFNQKLNLSAHILA